jgi:uncharacterized protein YbjT (DUF2867 family)
MKTALVIGATGLVGSQLVRLLLDDARFGQVLVFARRSTGLKHAKLKEHITDFDKLDAVRDAIRGDVLFSSLGTTIKTAGSKERQYEIDYTYQYEFAKRAAQNGVKTYVLISAAGASAGSPTFYMRMKGELERDVAKLPFRHIHILQPGFLDGERSEHRPGEQFGLAALKLINRAGLLRRYRPILGRTVARAMIAASFDESAPLKKHSPTTLFVLGESSHTR